MLIDIRTDHLQIIYNILKCHLYDHKVWVFGSRTRKAKKTSDLDLCIKGKTLISLKLLAYLRNDFSESNLPYKVDIVDWHSLNDSFKKIVERDKVLLNKIERKE